MSQQDCAEAMLQDGAATTRRVRAGHLLGFISAHHPNTIWRTTDTAGEYALQRTRDTDARVLSAGAAAGGGDRYAEGEEEPQQTD